MSHAVGRQIYLDQLRIMSAEVNSGENMLDRGIAIAIDNAGGIEFTIHLTIRRFSKELDATGKQDVSVCYYGQFTNGQTVELIGGFHIAVEIKIDKPAVGDNLNECTA